MQASIHLKGKITQCMHQASKNCGVAHLHFYFLFAFLCIHQLGLWTYTLMPQRQLKLTQIKACTSPSLLNSCSLHSHGIYTQAAVVLLPWVEERLQFTLPQFVICQHNHSLLFPCYFMVWSLTLKVH